MGLMTRRGFHIVLLATGMAMSAAPAAAEESASLTYGSVGLRYAIWGEADSNFSTENSPVQTAEFSWSLGGRSFFRARLEQASKKAASAADKVRRYGLDAGFEGLAVSSEFGRIAGVSTPTTGVSYQDVGPYDGRYSQVGLFQSGFTGWGLVYVDSQRPKLWRHSKGGCTTVSTHCYFTDRESQQKLLLAAWRVSTASGGDAFTTTGGGLDINAVWGLGLSRTRPTARAVAGASAATGVALESKPLSGIGYYIDGQFGWAYSMKTRLASMVFATGLYYRTQGSLAEQGGASGLEVWETGGDRDYGPYLRFTAAF
jgi:hypothetical protein